MTPPTILYKYQRPTDHAVANLREHRVWFSRPSDFNDPFDCRIRVDGEDLDDQTLVGLYEQLKSDVPDRIAFARQCFTKGGPNEAYRRDVRTAIDIVCRDMITRMLHTRSVACFSATHLSIPMWSHYAAGHHGSCLAFDGTKDPFNRAVPVQYSSDVPAIATEVVLRDAGEAYMAMITTKAQCWAYEEEWRVFNTEPGVSYAYPPSALTGVYLGALMSDTDMDRVISAVPNGVKVFQMQCPERRFELLPGQLLRTKKE